MNWRLWAAIAAVVLVVAGGACWAAAAYMSESAREKIDVALASLAPVASVTYEEVSVSPFTFTTTIEKLVVQPRSGLPIEIEHAHIRSIDTDQQVPRWLDLRLTLAPGALRTMITQPQTQGAQFILDHEISFDLSWAMKGGRLELAFGADARDIGSASASATLLNVQLPQEPLGMDTKTLVALTDIFKRLLLKELSVHVEDISLRRRLLTEEAKRLNVSIDEVAGKQLMGTYFTEAKTDKEKQALATFRKWLVEGGSIDLTVTPRPSMPFALVANASGYETFLKQNANNFELAQSGSSRFGDPQAWLNAGLANAVMMGHLEAVRRMVEDGADLNITHQGMTLLTLAAEKDRPDLLGFLLEKGAAADGKNADGTTALQRAEWLHNSEFTAWSNTIATLKKAGGKLEATIETPPSSFKPPPTEAQLAAAECPGKNQVDGEASELVSLSSADGKQTAVYRIVGGHMGVGLVYVKPRDDKSPAKIVYVDCIGAHIAMPLQLTDTSLLLYDYTQNLILTVDTKTGDIALQKRALNAQVSPDRKQLAYMGGAVSDGLCAVAILDTASLQTRNLQEGLDCSGRIVAWSPDGTRLLYAPQSEPRARLQNGTLGPCNAMLKDPSQGPLTDPACFQIMETNLATSSTRFVTTTIISSPP